LVVGSIPATRAIKKLMSKVGAYIKESYVELKQKVSWPTFEELQSSVIVVMVASLIIALIIFVMDFGFQSVMNLFYKMVA
jgi:preprotein translocase subunit SecE